MKKLYLFLISIIFYTCNSTNEPQIDNTLSGTVFDISGNTVANAIIEIEYRFDSEPSKVKNLISQKTMTKINFTVPEEDHLKLWISNYSDNDTVKILIDDTLKAGYYSIFWDGYSEENKLVRSDVYEYHIEYKSEYSSNYFMIMNYYDNIENPDTLHYYAITGSDGAYSIPYNQLAFSHDLEFILTDVYGNEIGTSLLSPIINIWTIHDLHGKATVYNFKVNKDSKNKIDIHY
jgi:hypothetical protein